jgi:hypothetical protein
LLVASLGVALACTEKFTGIDEPAAAGGESGGSDTETGGMAVVEAGRGGKPSGGSGGSGGTSVDPGPGGSAGMGGNLPVAGSGVGGSVVVEPAAVPEDGLELWLRSDQGVVEVGGVVATWKDSSSHQRNATQSEAGARPKLASDAMAGSSAVVFDGVDDYLQLPALDADFTGGVSIFAVALRNEADECAAVFEASNGSEVDDLHLGVWQGVPIYEVGAPYFHAVSAPKLFGQAALLTAVHYADVHAHVRRNSQSLGELDLELPPLVSRSEVFIGRSLYTNCTTWSGAIAELLVYSRAVSDQELVEIETYLQKKWGCCEQ